MTARTDYNRSNSDPTEFIRNSNHSAAKEDVFVVLDDPADDEDTNKKDTEDPPPPSAPADQQPTPESSDHNTEESVMTKGTGNGCGRGIVADFKRTVLKHWKREMVNFDLKTIAVSFFLFFACIAPAITFGAIYAKATHNWIGAVEMITATSWCGIVYALIGGQPMMINGGTGPVLAFTEILYKMSISLDIPFLTFNAWIGLWVAFYMLVAAFVDLNRIIVYATRFTDEIFAFLISTIFILNAICNPFAPVGVCYYFSEDHTSHDLYENDGDYSYMASALLSLLVFLGTVYLSFLIRKTKFTPFLYSQTTRNIVTDFAVVISIIAMTLVANLLFQDVQTETLNVPDTFAPTYSCCTESCETNWPEDCPDQSEPYGQRPWLVDLSDLNGKSWIPFMAMGPAVLAFILVFLDDGITWHLINHPSHKLTHGEAYNYDTVIIGLMIAINSMLGLPWLVAATVRSLNHIHAMAEKLPDGKIISVKETRLTHLGIHLLCLVSIFALDVLKLIPVPVLYGVFLFMGLVSLGTNQFWNRIMMVFMEPSRYPKEPYTEHVKHRRMHLYTAIQLALFVLLYVVKAIKIIAIAFPLIIACCIPFRLYVLPKIFSQEELVMLDSDEDTVGAWMAAKETEDEDHRKEDEEEGDEKTKHDDEISVDVTKPESQSEDESQDQLSPLPDIAGPANAQKHPRRRRRHKSLSCPTVGTLFDDEEPPSIFVIKAYDTEVCKEIKAEDDGYVEEEIPGTLPTIVDDVVAEEGVPRRRRRRRCKTVSCPPHMLFTEADRHINSNYFFG